jgi:hypothetical protein
VSKLSGEEVKNVKPKAEKKAKKNVAEEKGVVEDKSKSASKTSTTSTTSKTSKSPFWKRMGFGAAAMQDAEVKEGAHSQQDHTIPSQQLHSRSAGRGS